MNEALENKKESREIPVVTPKVNIMETESTVYLVAEMPGVNEKNVDVDLQGNNLTIRGKVEGDEDRSALELARAEYYAEKSYERQFTLGNTIDLSGITATMKDGILRLMLPKVKELAPRKIEVKGF